MESISSFRITCSKNIRKSRIISKSINIILYRKEIKKLIHYQEENIEKQKIFLEKYYLNIIRFPMNCSLKEQFF